MGASKTSPVPGNGMRRRHARRRILPRFGALRGDNTPSPALRGLRMITRSGKVATIAPRAVWVQGRRRTRLALASLSLWCVCYAQKPTLCMGAPGGLYRPTPRGYNCNPAGRWSQPSVSTLAGFSAGRWGPPTGGSRRLPASWSTRRPHHLGSCQRLLTVASPLMMRAPSR